MRKRTAEEERVMGLVDPIFRNLAIKRATRGYMPLMDLLCYAYVNPEKEFLDILEYLSHENFYVGIKPSENHFGLIPSIVRTIETALEGTTTETLSEYGLEKLSVIVQDRNEAEQFDMHEELLSELGEKYAEYKTHEERVIVFFSKKLLKFIQKK